MLTHSGVGSGAQEGSLVRGLATRAGQQLEYRSMPTTLKRRMLRAGGGSLVKRIIKPLPVVGAVFAVGLAGYEIKKKGLLRGVIHVGLDVTPVVGTAKNVVEIFTGDLIPDRVRKSSINDTVNDDEPRINADACRSELNG